MKKILKFVAIALLMSAMLCSCRNAGKYADDAYKYIDDAFSKYKPKPRRGVSTPKDCPYCEDGYIYVGAYQRECSKCEGRGWLWTK